MVILISAVSSTGKTLMAQQLLEKYKMPYLSIDHLKMGLYRSDYHCGLTPLDDTKVIANKLWPIVKGIIMTNIENKQHLIIEGCYIQPHYIDELDSHYFKKIIPVFFGFSPNYIEKKFDSEIKKHRNIIEFRNYQEERTMEALIHEHLNFKKACSESNVPYFEINHDYNVEIEKVYDYIDDKKREMNTR